jgi:hypothetical protein
MNSISRHGLNNTRQTHKRCTCSGLRNLNNRGRHHSVGRALHFPRRARATSAAPTFCPIVRDTLRQGNATTATVTSGAAVARCPRDARGGRGSFTRRRDRPLNAKSIDEARIGRYGRRQRVGVMRANASWWVAKPRISTTRPWAHVNTRQRSLSTGASRVEGGEITRRCTRIVSRCTWTSHPNRGCDHLCLTRDRIKASAPVPALTA